MKTMFVLFLLTLSSAFANEHAVLYPEHVANPSMSTPPAKVTLVEPTYMQKVNADSVTLKWNAVDGAESYIVQVATDPNFKWLVKEENLYTKTELSVSNLEANTHYFWRVAAVKSSNIAGTTKGPFAVNTFQK